MVVIEADLFQTEVLQHRGMDRIFKTASKVSSTNVQFVGSVKSTIWVVPQGRRG